MDKKNVDTSAKKPSFFEIFKTQYIESGTTGISIQADFVGEREGNPFFFAWSQHHTAQQPGQVCLSSSGRKKTAAKVDGETAENQKSINGGQIGRWELQRPCGCMCGLSAKSPNFDQILEQVVSPLIQYHCALNSRWRNCKSRTAYMKLFPWNMIYKITFVNSTLHVHFL